jgi:hypothetical protein
MHLFQLICSESKFHTQKHNLVLYMTAWIPRPMDYGIMSQSIDNLHVRLNFNLSKEKGIKHNS